MRPNLVFDCQQCVTERNGDLVNLQAYPVGLMTAFHVQQREILLRKFPT